MALYTLKCNNKTVGLLHQDAWYIIAFRSVYHARRVQYILDVEPKMLMRPMSVMIQKSQRGNYVDPVSDIGYYLETVPVSKISRYPVENGVGIIVAKEMQDDNELWISFMTTVIPPNDMLEFGNMRL